MIWWLVGLAGVALILGAARMAAMSLKKEEQAIREYYDAKWRRYEQWRDSQVCIGCGTPFKDRAPGEHWVTEYECGKCFSARCRMKAPDSTAVTPGT